MQCYNSIRLSSIEFISRFIRLFLQKYNARIDIDAGFGSRNESILEAAIHAEVGPTKF